QFTNAFLDPDVVSEIRGLLDGKIKLTGSLKTPLLEGSVELLGGSAYLDILGIHLGIEGPIHIDEYGFYMNGIPVFDEDGNSGSLVGAVFHDNFYDFNFDLQFDLESEKTTDGSTAIGESNKFLVMDLPYSHDGLYYGKGYVTGIANIFGYTDNLEITVDFKTVKGTTVNIPMYGVGEIEDETFITFVDYHSHIDSIITIPKFDLAGVVIDLNFNVTEDAEINIIFNEELGDVINARGTGDIAITLDDVGDVRMEGVYTVSNGAYNFALDPINSKSIALKQKFIIVPGGSISWIGDPYDAELNLRTYYTLNANLSQISNGDIASGKGAHQRILSYLELSGTMLSPSIGFDIQAPDADEIGRSLINRITSNPDELNRQFFFLMLTRRFQPIDAGNSGGNGSAALDLLANQINILLASVSSEYNLNFDFDQDQITGDNKLEFGVSKGFLDDRLILSGSFGVEKYGENAGVVDGNGDKINQELIGDVRLEYLLNESGTFRVNIFNESTDKTIITEGDLGEFTQGAGLNYREDFNTFKDFKLIQYIFDIFRRKDKKKYLDRRNKQQRAIPENVGTKEENDPVPVQDED
ncbi:MAG: translocation/assembly module TamB domain-containing protein, partial [Crocinitomicaceae bacterium]|nr:translocation/assembly module TamB domain-containing protein [Crocinitomicaceae bacterium]